MRARRAIRRRRRRRLLGNDEVALRGPWDGTEHRRVAPTAADLAGACFDYHLDFPGDALGPGAPTRSGPRAGRAARPDDVRARRHRAGVPGQLALQYWFFYVFNDFNNKHEGDWEMIQLDFDAVDREEALARRPTEVGYSQHDGAERADWGDDKLELVDGTHPVVYPAAGSHANYYGPALYLGAARRRAWAATTPADRPARSRPRPTFRTDRAPPWRPTRGSGSRATGARSMPPSSTGRRGRTPIRSGTTRSRGRPPGGIRPRLPYRKASRACRERRTSSAPASPQARTS